jgi:hypothetical protein
MHIEIHRPELEALINERLQTGVFENVEDVIWQALRNSIPPAKSDQPSKYKNLVEVFEPIRGLLTDEEIESVFGRNLSTGRRIDLE